MVHESLDATSHFTALMRSICIAVTRAKEIMDMPPVDIDREEKQCYDEHKVRYN